VGSLLHLISARMALEKGYGPLAKSNIKNSAQESAVWDRFLANGYAHRITDKASQRMVTVFDPEFLRSEELKELEDSLAHQKKTQMTPAAPPGFR
jgi:hypothetical protein